MKISMKNKLFLGKWNYLRLLCLAALIVCAGATAFSQVTLNVKDKPIRQVLKTIEKTTDYKFFYNDDFAALNKLVTINVTNVSLDNALKTIFMGSGISWKKQSDKLIVLTPIKSEESEGTTSGSGQHKITGIVVDASTGETLPGVNIFIAGKKIGVISNLDGRFSIDLPSANTPLEFSYLGYVNQTITPGKQTNLKIALEADVKKLDEVVVIGYGTVKRRDLTGAVSSIKGDAVASNPVANVAQALQGKLPGVNVTTQDGRPGASVSVRVRGGGSITQSNEPLYIVDGYPVGNISDLASSEIESIDVLKDASSTAIYGARGANGVILVTTKSGKAGRTKVSYEGYMQVKNVSKTLETLSAQDYVLLNWSYAASRGTANQDAVAKYFGLGSTYGNHYAEYANVKTHDYTNDILRTAFSQSHNVTISGGNVNTKIFSNIGYIVDQGIKINSDYKRINASLKRVKAPKKISEETLAPVYFDVIPS